MRRRSKKAAPEPDEALGGEGGDDTSADAPTAPEGVRRNGPWDVEEHPVEEDDDSRINLGSLSLKGNPALEVRLQVDEASQQVMAVMLVAQDGAAELRAFAAPRHDDVWDEVRRSIASEAAAQGGTASEVEGPYGPALELVVSGLDDAGSPVRQNSAIWGISGPRWLLRVSLFGRPVSEHSEDGLIEQAIRDTVVIRGQAPMAPKEALPLRLPPRARRVDEAQSTPGEGR